jgi:hypothetical protein
MEEKKKITSPKRLPCSGKKMGDGEGQAKTAENA